jgi:uncharacterized protein
VSLASIIVAKEFEMSSADPFEKRQISAVQQDWDDREFVEVVQINILKMAQFLNNFDHIVRSKIATMNERLTKLERMVDYCDAAAKSTQDRIARDLQQNQPNQPR